MRRLGQLALSVVLLAFASQIEVPMVPVPMTLQSLALLGVATFLGGRWGPLAVVGWLGLAALGAPVLAGGTGGAARFVGPTAGYLAAFPVAAALVGHLADRGTLQRGGPAMAAMLGAHAIILTLGWGRLAWSIGPAPAWSAGVGPFLAGMVVKSAVAAGLATRRRPTS